MKFFTFFKYKSRLKSELHMRFLTEITWINSRIRLILKTMKNKTYFKISVTKKNQFGIRHTVA